MKAGQSMSQRSTIYINEILTIPNSIGVSTNNSSIIRLGGVAQVQRAVIVSKHNVTEVTILVFAVNSGGKSKLNQ
jgi:hypothetical protein